VLLGIAAGVVIVLIYRSWQSNRMPATHLDYDASIRRLQKLGYLGRNEHPPLRDRVPQPEDAEPLGLSFFRTRVGGGVVLGNLTIPRTFFGRSEMDHCSFQKTDLTESNLRWNEFTDVDFTEAVLARSDLR
jgi:uncharacterized protein YjbI with pentapeptide repeats